MVLCCLWVHKIMLGLPAVSAVESGPTAQALFKSLLSGVDNCTREQLTAKEIAANEHLNELKNVTLINILVVVVLVVVLLANAKEGKYILAKNAHIKKQRHKLQQLLLGQKFSNHNL